MKPLLKKLTGIFVLLVIGSCSTFTTDKIAEGMVEYEISYPKPGESNIAQDLLPKTMKYYFKDDRSLAVISAGMGAFKTYVIAAEKDRKLIQGLWMLTKKYKVDFSPSEMDSMLNAEPPMEIERSNETKKIAGYTCKKVRFHFRDKQLGMMDVYYTEDLQQGKPNWYSIYHQLNGTLMEFYLHRYGLHMKMTAKRVESTNVEDQNFELGSDYEVVNPQRMEEFFKI